jgi:hypothetical protein
MGTNRLADAAMAYAARDWPVFPLTPGGKLPAIPTAHPGQQSSCRGECDRFGHGVYDATTHAGVITRWWDHCPRANIGLSCGPAGLVVIDLDVPKPGRETPPPDWRLPGVTCGADVLAVLAERASAALPTDTYTVRTGRGGLHLYFTTPPGAQLGNTTADRGSGIGWCIDTRAAGGYVVAGGSTVAGRDYTLVHDAPPAPLPPWLASLLIHPPTRPQRPAPSHTAVLAGIADRPGYAGAALREEVRRVLDAPEGARNHTLNTAAFALGQLVAGGLLPADLAENALTRAGQAAGLRERECAATIRSGLGAGARRPRHNTGGAA